MHLLSLIPVNAWRRIDTVAACKATGSTPRGATRALIAALKLTEGATRPKPRDVIVDLVGEWWIVRVFKEGEGYWGWQRFRARSTAWAADVTLPPADWSLERPERQQTPPGPAAAPDPDTQLALPLSASLRAAVQPEAAPAAADLFPAGPVEAWTDIELAAALRCLQAEVNTRAASARARLEILCPEA
jgi:hypothetical protein